MSIIHDALKKVQSNLNPQQPSSPFDDVKAEAPQETIILSTKKKFAPINLGIVAVAIAITAISIYYIYTQLLTLPQFKEWKLIAGFKAKRTLASMANPSNEKSAQPLGQITVASTLPNTGTPDPSQPVAVSTFVKLNVQGIMANGAGNVVLINDKILQEGDEISGVKILRISLNEIAILNNGKEEIIAVGKTK